LSHSQSITHHQSDANDPALVPLNPILSRTPIADTTQGSSVLTPGPEQVSQGTSQILSQPRAHQTHTPSPYVLPATAIAETEHIVLSPQLPPVEDLEVEVNQPVAYATRENYFTPPIHSVQHSSSARLFSYYENDTQSTDLSAQQFDEHLDDQFLTISEKAGMARADTLARQWFMATLNNKTPDTVVQSAFVGMAHGHATFKHAQQRVRSLFKTWKNRTLNEARKWFADYVTIPSNQHLSDVTDFKLLKKHLNRAFELHWAVRVFPWSYEAIAFGDCTESGKRFVKCMHYLYMGVVFTNSSD
jgi:hypothetical protein